MLNLEIREFIEAIRKLNAVGCILVQEGDQALLLENLDQADQVVGASVQSGRTTYYRMASGQPFPAITVPAVLIATEEQYSQDRQLREKIREKAGYFLNVRV